MYIVPCSLVRKNLIRYIRGVLLNKAILREISDTLRTLWQWWRQRYFKPCSTYRVSAQHMYPVKFLFPSLVRWIQYYYCRMKALGVCLYCQSLLLPPGRMGGVYGDFLDTSRTVSRSQKLEVSYISDAVVRSSGTIGQCTMEENTAFVGATLNDGTMRIKSVESGVYLFLSHRSMACPHSHITLNWYCSFWMLWSMRMLARLRCMDMVSKNQDLLPKDQRGLVQGHTRKYRVGSDDLRRYIS